MNIKNGFLIGIIFLVVSSLNAQSSESSDPKAKSLLDKAKKLYEGYKTLETNFTLSLKMAEQPKEDIQKGKFYQEGEKYKVEIGKQTIWSDGKVIWHKTDNTVKIMTMGKKKQNGIMSPKDLIKIYEGKDYVYALQGETKEGWSAKATIVVFKPVNRRSEYSQIKAVFDQKSNQLVSITAFGKDQSRFKLTLEQGAPNKQYAANFFIFDKSKFPNIKVEDLRED